LKLLRGKALIMNRIVKPELVQRANLLGRLISAIEYRDYHSSGETDFIDDATWSASSLAVNMLKQAIWLAPPFQKDEAIAIVGADNFENLLSLRLVRIVFDEVKPMLTVSQRYCRGVSSKNEADLDKLRKAMYGDNRGKLWLSDKEAIKLIRCHRKCNKLTPDEGILLDFLEPFTVDENDGYLLKSRQSENNSWFRKILPLACAKLWSSFVNDNSKLGAKEFIKWMNRSGDGFFHSPSYMPLPHRNILLNIAIDMLNRDPNLGDLDYELASPLLWLEDNNPEITRNTPAEIHMLWQYLNTRIASADFDDTRMPISRIVGLVLKYDQLKFGEEAKASKLVQLAVKKPFLLQLITRGIVHNKPEVIAWLFIYPSTVALALSLLIDLDLQDTMIMDSLSSRNDRLHARRLWLLREAMPLALRSISQSYANVHYNKDVSIHCVLDSLRVVARRVVRSSFVLDNSQHTSSAYEQAEEYFHLVFMGFRMGKSPYSISIGRLQSIPYLLMEMAPKLVSEVASHFPSSENVEFLKVATELLKIFYENQYAEQDNVKESLNKQLGDIALMIYNRYISSFSLDATMQDYRFFSRSQALVDLFWGYTLCIFSDCGILKKFLDFSEIRIKLTGLASDSDGYEHLTAGCSARFRVHLEILLRSYTAIRKIRTVSQTTRERVSAELEKHIELLVLGKTSPEYGTVAIFDRNLVVAILGDNSLELLLRLAVRTIQSFGDGKSDKLLLQLINQTSDPSVLLDMEKELFSSLQRNAISKKLAESTIIERITDEHSLTPLQDMVYEAASANHIELAEKLLVYGDKVTINHCLRREWELVAFRSRLLIAFQKNDRDTIENLPAPESAQSEKIVEIGKDQSAEQSRSFYLALIDLPINPRAAEISFKRQLSKNPTSISIIENLYAARLWIAKSIENKHEQRQSYEKALRWWQKTRDCTADQKTRYGELNELIALDGAELDDEFDLFWYRLEEPIRFRPELINVRLENLKRRSIGKERANLLLEVRSHFRDDLPIELNAPSLPKSGVADKKERNVGDYRNIWDDIRGLSPQKLSRVLGRTEERELADFILNLHIKSSCEMLHRFWSLDKIKNEDKINDLLVSYIKVRINLFDWGIREQPRGAVSGNGGIGERDWVIDCHDHEICICEAMRLDSIRSDYIMKHLAKLLSNYNPLSAKLSIIIIYYEGSNFSTFNMKYRNFIDGKIVKDWEIKIEKSHHSFSENYNNMKVYRSYARNGEEQINVDHLIINIKYLKPIENQKKNGITKNDKY